MAARKTRKTRKKSAATGRPAAPADTRTAAVYDLMTRAERLYNRRQYRQAMAVCAELAKLDPTNAMPEQMIEGCRREIRNRRAIVLSVVLALALAALGIAAVYTSITRVRIRPQPGALRLREHQTQVFSFRSPLGYHKTLEYRWRLLAADGQPVPVMEEGTLGQHVTSPWECWYTPPYNLVRSAAGGKPVVRRLTATGVNASGREVLQGEWAIEVADTPLAPTILSIKPPTDDVLSVVAGGGSRVLQVEAADGDGGTDLVYEWSVGQTPVHRAAEPAWVYRPPADAVPAGATGREPSFDPPLAVTCCITNGFGEALPQTVTWRIRPVRSNARPQLLALEPPLSHLVHLREGEAMTVTGKAYDPDDEVPRYRWELDGETISRRPTCVLRFPYTTTDSEKTLTLRLTVTDCCGEQVARSWQIRVVDAPRPPTKLP